ncbi:hypothetical protein L2735_19820 [Shewanella olleyana]|uniref:hypothetical protein n=1 Tax=Shewanella olleyana TaxID=135626 RepID=UPI00200BBE8B|nr:hypothetical protein [Shewanella olleyana]MCL1069005.1 hypothetical protein [Shewanella olleyana]
MKHQLMRIQEELEYKTRVPTLGALTIIAPPSNAVLACLRMQEYPLFLMLTIAVLAFVLTLMIMLEVMNLGVYWKTKQLLKTSDVNNDVLTVLLKGQVVAELSEAQCKAIEDHVKSS